MLSVTAPVLPATDVTGKAIAAVPALVTRPCASTVTVATLVVLPYEPALTPVFVRLRATLLPASS